jgi:hypothetical protein
MARQLLKPSSESFSSFVFSIDRGFCVLQRFKIISDCYLRWVVLFVSCGVFFFIVATFVVLGHGLFLPFPLTACQDSWSSLSSLSILLIMRMGLCLLLLFGMCG